MKKKLLSAAIILSGIIGFTAAAQDTTDNTTATETTGNTVCHSEPAKCHHRNNSRRNHHMRFKNPFEGIELTADQKTKLEALKTTCKGNKTECLSGKTAGHGQYCKDNQCDKPESRRSDRATQKRRMLDDIKAILTPDQYVIFLENIAVNQAPAPHRHMHR